MGGVGERGDDARRERRSDRPRALPEFGPGEIEAAIVGEDEAAPIQRLARPGQRLQHGIVPEQQLQQQRSVAHHLDIEQRDLRENPVVREPGDPDREPQRRRQRDRYRGHQQRVAEPDPERAAVGRKRGIVDQRLVDGEAGGLVPEAEAHGNAARLHVDDGVAPAGADQRRERPDQQRLIEQPPRALIVDQRRRHPHPASSLAPAPRPSRADIASAAVARKDRRRQSPWRLSGRFYSDCGFVVRGFERRYQVRCLEGLDRQIRDLPGASEARRAAAIRASPRRRRRRAGRNPNHRTRASGVERPNVVNHVGFSFTFAERLYSPPREDGVSALLQGAGAQNGRRVGS